MELEQSDLGSSHPFSVTILSLALLWHLILQTFPHRLASSLPPPSRGIVGEKGLGISTQRHHFLSSELHRQLWAPLPCPAPAWPLK